MTVATAFFEEIPRTTLPSLAPPRFTRDRFGYTSDNNLTRCTSWFVGAKPQGEGPSMGAKHRMTDIPERRRPPTVARPRSIFGVASASMLCALAALVINAFEPDRSADTKAVTSQSSPRVPQQVSQEGMLIAVSANSVTARSANGYTQTYLVNSNTAVMADGVSQPATATSHFTVNDEVEIVGTIQGGTALATAVADRDMGHGHGPPMDYVGGQPVSGPTPTG